MSNGCSGAFCGNSARSKNRMFRTRNTSFAPPLFSASTANSFSGRWRSPSLAPPQRAPIPSVTKENASHSPSVDPEKPYWKVCPVESTIRNVISVESGRLASKAIRFAFGRSGNKKRAAT